MVRISKVFANMTLAMPGGQAHVVIEDRLLRPLYLLIIAWQSMVGTAPARQAGMQT